MDYRVLSSVSKSIAPFSLLLLLYIFPAAETTAANTTYKAFNLSTITFEEGYSPLFSDFNIERSPDDRSFRLLLNKFSGSGVISTEYYNYGFFSASIKLPAIYTAGIVVAFYTSNADTFEKNHDELDIEFLGNVNGQPWRFQTNMYGNGSVSRGREERYRMWFDPSKDFHQYSILWTPKNIIFYIDETPLREINRHPAMGGDFPSKPMSLYATIWDASSWATNGGKAKVDYKFEPFATELKDLVLEGCIVDPTEQIPSTNCTDRSAKLLAQDYSNITTERRKSMKFFRERYMYYSYCYDNLRYPVPPPECVIVQSERDLFRDSGRLRQKMKFGGSHSHSQSHRKHRPGRSSRRRNKVAGGASKSGRQGSAAAAM
ncbi:hypothetical protein KY285_033700 [Solanum tuberosum]|uniref:Xyloglucan endotransglucosylase/hydrolase n=2 Tax=Solanum tuberosum TaxID=4113 RepID=M1AJC6_SOLTU|nr:hypothetical protein KY284_033540 [Solanum tuberosum]KAH0648452.1 hypothetical protein KY285_033700 [Solanum tuberosum]